VDIPPEIESKLNEIRIAQQKDIEKETQELETKKKQESTQ
jgi:hypothetical protein